MILENFPLPHGIMIGAQTKTFPTLFAIELSIGCGLYVPDDEETGNEEEWYDLRDRLSNFQKMAITSNFETSMVAYYSIKDELSTTQMEVLQFIHANTKSWLKGHVGAVMLDNLERTSRSNNKDKQAIAEMFLEHFVDKSDGEEGSKKKKKGLLVRFTDTEGNDIKLED